MGHISMAAAVAAAKLGRPVRVMLDRDEDMLMTGHRNPFYAKYKVGFNNDGTVKAVDVDYVSGFHFPRFTYGQKMLYPACILPTYLLV